MSFDLLVWHPDSTPDAEEALKLYTGLCEGESWMVSAHPAISRFYDDLIAKHPELDDVPEEDVDDTDLCPWSCAIDKSPGHVITCCIWTKADYVKDLVSSLARKHGLTIYDPQSDMVMPPQ